MHRSFGDAAGRGAQTGAPGLEGLPQSFLTALGDLRRAAPRSQALVEETPAPSKLAPYAVALRAEVRDPATSAPGSHPVPRLRPAPQEDELLATGRFIPVSYTHLTLPTTPYV